MIEKRPPVSAVPPTTGGSTIDSVHNARTSPRPGSDERARTQASGTPNTSDTSVDHDEQRQALHRAVATVCR